jgi:hypothetical protein
MFQRFLRKEEPTSIEGKLSKWAYEPNENERSKLAASEGFNLDQSLSDTNHSVFTKNGKSYVSFKGTSNASDLLPDWNIFANKTDGDETYKKGLEVVQKAQQKYGNNIELVGHSKGGHYAGKIAENLKLPATVLAPGFSPFSKKQDFGPTVKIRKLSGDPVSEGSISKLGKFLYDFKRDPLNEGLGAYNRHRIGNF